jgi:hypothetical protein
MAYYESHTHSAQYSNDAGATWIDFTSYVEAFTTHHGYQADRGTADISCYVYPSGLAENDLVILYIDDVLVFNGRMARPSLHYAGNSAVIACEDVMANLSYPWGGEGTDPELDEQFNRVYDDQVVSAIITNYCEAMGVDVSLHDIEDSTWNPCQIAPVVLRVGQTPLSQIREWDEIEGAWTASRNNGAITRRAIAIDPHTWFAADEGDNIISADRTPLGTESITNRWIVYGFEYEGGLIGGLGVGDFQLDNDNIPDPPKSRTRTVRSNFVQSDADALAFATAGVGRTNFPYDEDNITLLGNPNITIGLTMNISSSLLDHAGGPGSYRFIAEVSHRYGAGVGFETQVKCIRTE